jgi:osmotically-inducible protein OsmY
MTSFWRRVLAAALIVLVSACSQTPTRQSTGEFLDDSVLTTKVKAALLADVAVNAFRIHVRTDNDVVHLNGVVNSEQIRLRAGEIAGKIDGVRAVQNNIVVR